MSTSKGKSIKTKIILSILGLCLLSLAVVGFVVGTEIKSTLKEGTKRELVNTVSERSKQYNLIFQRLYEELNTVKLLAAEVLRREGELSNLDKPVLMPWVGEGTGSGSGKGYGSLKLNDRLASKVPKMQRIGKILEGVGSSNNLIILAYFVSPEGIFVSDQDAVTAKISDIEAWIPSKRPWYLAATTQRKTAWTKPYIDANTKKLVVTVSSPVYSNDNRLVGIAAFDILLQTIKDDILMIDLEYEGYSFLVGNDGKALVMPTMTRQSSNWNKEHETENLLNTSNKAFSFIVSKMVEQNTGIGEFTVEKEGNKYLAYAPLSELDASVGIVVSEKDVVQSAFDIVKWISIIALVFSVLAILIGNYLSNSITKPIVGLTEKANAISSGKAKLSTLKVTRTDEIGALTTAFNRLIIGLHLAMKKRKK